ncbi:hypothetical protein TNCV_3243661 [Trichonephila clavipes]|nr:hypothetical protein TNCV_3243661 [Trichonephila clavipes]
MSLPIFLIVSSDLMGLVYGLIKLDPFNIIPEEKIRASTYWWAIVFVSNLGGRTGKILRPSSVALKSKNQEINRLQLAVKLPWAIFFESVDILS